jgi:hypothetical protein
MDYIAKVRRDKRRFLGFVTPKNKYQQRKESTVLDFLFFQKKLQKRKKLNKFKLEDIEKYIEAKKNWSLSTKKERRAILRAFYKRNSLHWR